MKSGGQGIYHHWHKVTPCVGVWIEIGTVLRRSRARRSLPAWECGLKLKMLKEEYGDEEGSLPAWECGLKLEEGKDMRRFKVSLPAWECGLKWA